MEKMLSWQAYSPHSGRRVLCCVVMVSQATYQQETGQTPTPSTSRELKAFGHVFTARRVLSKKSIRCGEPPKFSGISNRIKEINFGKISEPTFFVREKFQEIFRRKVRLAKSLEVHARLPLPIGYNPPDTRRGIYIFISVHCVQRPLTCRLYSRRSCREKGI